MKTFISGLLRNKVSQIPLLIFAGLCLILPPVVFYALNTRDRFVDCQNAIQKHRESEIFWNEILDALGKPTHDEWDEKFFFKNLALKNSVLKAEQQRNQVLELIKHHGRAISTFEKAMAKIWLYAPPPEPTAPFDENRLLLELEAGEE